MGGWVTLLRSILNSMPFFYMSLFQICTKVKTTIKKIQKRFLWEGPNLVCKLYHVNWDLMCNVQNLGGLGLVDLGLKNRALLNKWLWSYDNELESFLRHIIVEKLDLDYDSILPSIEHGNKRSNIWKNIIKPFHGTGEYCHFTTNGKGISLGNRGGMDKMLHFCLPLSFCLCC